MNLAEMNQEQFNAISLSSREYKLEQALSFNTRAKTATQKAIVACFAAKVVPVGLKRAVPAMVIIQHLEVFKDNSRLVFDMETGRATSGEYATKRDGDGNEKEQNYLFPSWIPTAGLNPADLPEWCEESGVFKPGAIQKDGLFERITRNSRAMLTSKESKKVFALEQAYGDQLLAWNRRLESNTGPAFTWRIEIAEPSNA